MWFRSGGKQRRPSNMPGQYMTPISEYSPAETYAKGDMFMHNGDVYYVSKGRPRRIYINKELAAGGLENIAGENWVEGPADGRKMLAWDPDEQLYVPQDNTHHKSEDEETGEVFALSSGKELFEDRVGLSHISALIGKIYDGGLPPSDTITTVDLANGSTITVNQAYANTTEALNILNALGVGTFSLLVRVRNDNVSEQFFCSGFQVNSVNLQNNVNRELESFTSIRGLRMYQYDDNGTLLNTPQIFLGLYDTVGGSPQDTAFVEITPDRDGTPDGVAPRVRIVTYDDGLDRSSISNFTANLIELSVSFDEVATRLRLSDGITKTTGILRLANQDDQSDPLKYLEGLSIKEAIFNGATFQYPYYGSDSNHGLLPLGKVDPLIELNGTAGDVVHTVDSSTIGRTFTVKKTKDYSVTINLPDLDGASIPPGAVVAEIKCLDNNATQLKPVIINAATGSTNSYTIDGQDEFYIQDQSLASLQVILGGDRQYYVKGASTNQTRNGLSPEVMKGLNTIDGTAAATTKVAVDLFGANPASEKFMVTGLTVRPVTEVDSGAVTYPQINVLRGTDEIIASAPVPSLASNKAISKDSNEGFIVSRTDAIEVEIESQAVNLATFDLQVDVIGYYI